MGFVGVSYKMGRVIGFRKGGFKCFLQGDPLFFSTLGIPAIKLGRFNPASEWHFGLQRTIAKDRRLPEVPKLCFFWMF